ncbi:MAG: hypothetical protein KGZ86_04155, partial [Candidatus Latescibacteria bacterium]|nr:hypothetical protein [Candidatus Latescibacterota bacterium]
MKTTSKYTTESRRAQRTQRLLLILSLWLCVSVVFVSPLSAATRENPWKPPRVLDFQWYAKNQWRIPITNYGTFGYGIGRPGGEWPRGSGNMYIYGAGFWVGCMPSRLETLVTCGYNPSSGNSEFTPGAWDNAPGGYSGRTFERVYISPEDWPPRISDFPESMRDSIETPLRIPLATGDTLKGHIYPIPRSVTSSYDAWTVFNDRDPDRHTTPKIPIGVEVYQYTYSWNLPWNRDIVFFKYYVRNVTSDTLKRMYLGMACDPDIGGANDDMVGLLLRNYVKNRAGTDSVFADNVGYCYDNDFDEGWATPPGYIGFDFLQSPYAYDDGIDNNGNGIIDEGPDGIDNNGNGLIDEPAELEQLGMTAFKMFTLQAGDPVTNYTQYLAMAGYNYWESPPVYSPYDSIDPAPNDKRFLQSTGPFDLPPGEITTITIAVMAAPSNPVAGVGELYQLGLTSAAAQAAYDNYWIMPEAPPTPNLTLIPGEGRITLIWDNVAETARDGFYTLAATLRNPFYREYDFQGYKIYRSLTGKVGAWALLEQFDKIDGLVYEDPTVVDSLRTRATDKGLSYAYVDSSNIRLGFPYYYAVTAYDVNTLGGDPNPADTTWLSLESGMSPKSTIARTTPSNYIPPWFNIIKIFGGEKLYLKLNPLALTSYAVKSDVYTMKFLAPEPTGPATARIPIYQYLITNQDNDTVVPVQTFSFNIRNPSLPVTYHPTVFDNVITNIREVEYDSIYPDASIRKHTRVDTTIAYMPVIDLAFTLRMDSIPLQPFDRVLVKTGAYPQDSLQISYVANNYALWAYRGSAYQIVWKKKRPDDPQSPLTAEVYDLTLSQMVPYRRMRGLTLDADSANGWSFFLGSDTLRLNSTLNMTICGGQFNFNLNRPIRILPAPEDTWIIYNKPISCAPAFSEFQIISHPMQIVTESIVSQYKVKVVPNPYLVRNEWERHPDYRKIKFINLPDRCTIRIYNFAGDLLKTITHTATNITDPGNLPLQSGGDQDWDLLTESGQKPAPGIYLFHIESETGNQVGKFA